MDAGIQIVVIKSIHHRLQHRCVGLLGMHMLNARMHMRAFRVTDADDVMLLLCMRPLSLSS